MREQPLQHCEQLQETPEVFGGTLQPDETPVFLQQVPPTPQLLLQHCPEQEHPEPTGTQAGVLQVPLLQVSGQPQLPQFAVRAVPQLSMPLLLPQVFPRREQKAPSFSGVQTQVLEPLQVRKGAVPQVPQLVTVRAAPQRSVPVFEPQTAPVRVQKAALVSMQPQVLATPPPAQLWGGVQGPQLVTVRLAPQLSVPVKEPHALPSRAQKAESASAAHPPQTLSWGPPEQVWGRVQVPQLVTVRERPHESVSETVPHVFPRRAQKVASVSVGHTHVLPEVQAVGMAQVPQLATVRGAPQASFAVTGPQRFPRRAQKAASVSAHAHTLVGEQVSEAEQVPQLAVRAAKQLSRSVTMPQVFPSRLQNLAFDSEVQPGVPHVLSRPPPPQVSAPEQVPQSLTDRVVPQLSAPEVVPHEAPRRPQSWRSLSGTQPPSRPPPSVTPPPAPPVAPPEPPPPVVPPPLPRSRQRFCSQRCVAGQRSSFSQWGRVSMMNEQAAPRATEAASELRTKRFTNARAYSESALIRGNRSR